MIILYYLYYRIYRIWIKMKGNDNAFLAMMALSMLLILNITTFLVSLGVLKNSNYTLIKLSIILGIISILFLNYFILVHNRKYLKIETLFIKETKIQIFIGNLTICTYVILTFVSLFLVLF